MNRTGRLVRWVVCTAIGGVLLALAPALPAAATTQVVTGGLISGISSTPGSTTDTFTSVSVNGAFPTNSTIVPPLPGWGSLTGNARWISTDADPAVTAPTTAVFRRPFTLPAGFLSGSLSICLHSEDYAVVRLNKVEVFSQTPGDAGNATDPADCLPQPVSTGLKPGVNVLEFVVHSSAGAIGLDYLAGYSYTEELNPPPLLILPDDMIVPATSADGAFVNYVVDGIESTAVFPVISCSPAPGLFPIGTTTVTCTATGHTGLTDTGSFTVSVTPLPQTNSPPELLLPGNMTVDGHTRNGQVVTYSATATDDGAAPPTVVCAPPSGSKFPNGRTTVHCVATDDEGASTEGAFAVTVVGPLQRACGWLRSVPGITVRTAMGRALWQAAIALHEAGYPGYATVLRHQGVKVYAATGRNLTPALRKAVLDKVRPISARFCGA